MSFDLCTRSYINSEPVSNIFHEAGLIEDRPFPVRVEEAKIRPDMDSLVYENGRLSDTRTVSNNY